MLYDLAVILPVYNEEGCITDVIHSWHRMLKENTINFKMIILNDGSKDATAKALEQFSSFPEIQIINKKNSGHGPTILTGYWQAVREAIWVFQCDRDNELKPVSFVKLWQQRENYDALFGIRTGRVQNWLRKIISAVSRMTVYAFCGKGVSDVNVPYRLIRSSVLEGIINQIPEDTFAPNVIISAALTKMKARLWECPVDYQPRQTGKSLASIKAFKAAFKAFRQTGECLSRMKYNQGEIRGV